MAILPLTPQIKIYHGGQESLHVESAREYARAQRVCDHVNALIANNPTEHQMYLFGTIAIDLGISRQEVFDAISDGGLRGISFEVTDQDRKALDGYKRQ